MKDAEAIDYLEYWYQALRHPVGIAIATNSIERLRAKLYEVRRATGDPKLETLSITPSPNSTNELWIVHKKVTIADGQES